MKMNRSQQFSELLLKLTHDLSLSSSLEETLERLIEVTTTTLNADRGTIFLNDTKTSELYSRVAQGNLNREIRMLNDQGIAGYSYINNESLIVKNAYKDKRFNKEVDEICEECKECNTSVQTNLIMYGYKICDSCKISKTIFPV